MDNIGAYTGGIVRILTTLVGGYLAQKGLATEEETAGLIGALVLAATGIWSIWAKRKALAAVPPEATNAASVKKALGLILMAGLLHASVVLLSGCALVHGKAGDSSYFGLAFGEKAATGVSGLNLTETETTDGNIVLDRGVGLDKANSSGEADINKMLGTLLVLGLQSKGVPVRAPAPEVEAEPAAEETEEVEEPAPAKTKAVKKTAAKKKVVATLPPETVAANASILAERMAEAKASGKPLVVIAGATGCGYCSKLDKLVDADAAFLAREDIVLYRETSPRATNQAFAWTGGGKWPVLRVTQWGADGKTVCDKKVERPLSVADITAALATCSDPK